MIDWNNLPTLRSRRQPDPQDRERLAAERLARARAKHKGRNHWRNWERRQMAKAVVENRLAQHAKSKAAYARHVAEVRAYWAGIRPDHPEKPS